AAGLAPTDQLMASAGPAMEAVGRYERVLNHLGDPVDPAHYLVIARRAVEEAAAVVIDRDLAPSSSSGTAGGISRARRARRAGAGTRRSPHGRCTPCGPPAPAPLLSARCDPRQWGRVLHTAILSRRCGGLGFDC